MASSNIPRSVTQWITRRYVAGWFGRRIRRDAGEAWRVSMAVYVWFKPCVIPLCLVCNPVQPNATQQPIYNATGFGSGAGGVIFDGVNDLLVNLAASIGTASTMFAVFRDDGSSGGTDGPCCSGVIFFTVRRLFRRNMFCLRRKSCWLSVLDSRQNSFNGIATLPVPSADDDNSVGGFASSPIVTKLDYAGSPANGHMNVAGRLVVATSQYTAEGDRCVHIHAPGSV